MKQLNRRQFMSVFTGAIGALISIGLGIPAIAYILGPALKKDEEKDWISIATASNIELGTPTLFKAKVQHQTGWIVDEEQISVYVVTENGRDFTALSNICTHLGCRIRWIVEQDGFFCPCHNGVFDIDGQIVSGPVPRPLDRFETKVKDNLLYILGG